jgi:hypothetical protein
LAHASLPWPIRPPSARCDGSLSIQCHLPSSMGGKSFFSISWNAATTLVQSRGMALKVVGWCGPTDGGRARILANWLGVFAALERWKRPWSELNTTPWSWIDHALELGRYK